MAIVNSCPLEVRLLQLGTRSEAEFVLRQLLASLSLVEACLVLLWIVGGVVSS